MAEFDPDAYLAKKAAGASAVTTAFDPDQYLARKAAETARERPKMAAGEAFGHGLMQGASLGLADEGAAAMGATKDWAAGKLGLRGDVGWKDAYDTYIKPIRRDTVDTPLADQKGAFIGGNILGGVATAAVPGLAVAKGASGLKKFGAATALGAATGAGTSTADPTKSPEALAEFGLDVGTGALLGGAIQVGTNVAGKAFNALKPSELRNLANVKTVKAAGALGSDLKRMGPERVQQVGEFLAESGAVKMGSGLSDIAERTGAMKQDAGEAIGAALGSVDDLVVQAKNLIDNGKIGNSLHVDAKANLKGAIDKQFQFNMARIGSKIRKSLIEPNKKMTQAGDLEFTPELKGELQKLDALASDFERFAPSTLTKGTQTKAALGRKINFNSETVPERFKQEVYGIVAQELDEIVAKTGNLESAVGRGKGNFIGDIKSAERNASAAKAYAEAKKAYSILKETNQLATNRLGQTQGNNEFGLTDYMAAGAGLATGGAPAAIVLGGLRKLSRQYGDSVVAAGARTAADVIEQAPQKLGKFASMLEYAAGKGRVSLNATHVSLMDDPDYRAILNNWERSQAMRRRLGGRK